MNRNSILYATAALAIILTPSTSFAITIQGAHYAGCNTDFLTGPRTGSVCLNSFALEISGFLPGFLGRCDTLLGCDAGRA